MLEFGFFFFFFSHSFPGRNFPGGHAVANTISCDLSSPEGYKFHEQSSSRLFSKGQGGRDVRG